MKTIADPRVLESLLLRLGRVEPGTQRRWGTLTPQEMLCHLGDATDMVLLRWPCTASVRARRRPIVKSLGLWLPIPWPRRWLSSPQLDPKAEGTRPTDFDHACSGRSQDSRRCPWP
ncbi:MAG TPA: hypothetical protein VLA09_11290 [Longimicrobiales bacterium]|nr:hypothetical protein [Longimicrobiales bacterium]